MNMFEACLNHWFDKPDMIEVRDLLQKTLVTLAVALENEDPHHLRPVSEIIRKALQTDVTVQYSTPALGQNERGTNGWLV